MSGKRFLGRAGRERDSRVVGWSIEGSALTVSSPERKL
jgi:hypothetical protein